MDLELIVAMAVGVIAEEQGVPVTEVVVKNIKEIKDINFLESK